MTDKTATTQVYRIVIKASAQAIWDAITKPECTEKYGYGGRVHFDLRPGGKFVTAADVQLVAGGWASLAEYRAARDAITVVTRDEPPEVRARITTAWHARNYPEPMTRDQLGEWQSTVEDILWTFQAQAVAEHPDPVPVDPEVAA